MVDMLNNQLVLRDGQRVDCFEAATQLRETYHLKAVAADPIAELIFHYRKATKQQDNKPKKIVVEHFIPTIGGPVNSAIRQYSPNVAAEIDRQFKEMLKEGIVRPSKSEWSSPLVTVVKKNGEIRICGDYRKLNKVTVNDSFPLPHIQSFNQKLANQQFFSKIDLKSAYNHIPVHEPDIKKTAVLTPVFLYEYVKMPFF